MGDVGRWFPQPSVAGGKIRRFFATCRTGLYICPRNGYTDRTERTSNRAENGRDSMRGMVRHYAPVAGLLAGIAAAGVLLTVLLGGGRTESAAFTVVTTNYPLYVAAQQLTAGVDGVAVENLTGASPAVSTIISYPPPTASRWRGRAWCCSTAPGRSRFLTMCCRPSPPR